MPSLAFFTLDHNCLLSSPADCELLEGVHLPVPTTEIGNIVQSVFWLFICFTNLMETVSSISSFHKY